MIEAELLPSGSLTLGNIFTFAELQLTTRIGYNVPDDFGENFMVPRVARGGHPFSAYMLAGVKGRAIARNIFLDGNTFSDSHSVDKEEFVGDAFIGANIRLWEFEALYTYTWRSKEFDGQDRAHAFNSVRLSYRF